jgi:hypothetical protein
MDADLTVRWRTELKRGDHLFVRVALVGDEVWWVDSDRHAARRFARTDGKALGKLGGAEPAGAKVHHLDLKGATDVVGCPDGTVLALVAHRLVRYDAAGAGILTWPPRGCLSGWLGGERLAPLYVESADPDYRPTTAERGGEIANHLGQRAPTHLVTVFTRALTAADGSLWLFDGVRLARYDRDGTCRWTATLGTSEILPPRPGIDGDLNVYAISLEREDRPALYRVSPAGQVTRLTADGLGSVGALAVTPDARIVLFGYAAGEVRVFDRDGKRIRASAAAVEADRSAAEDERYDEDEDEDE